MPETLFENGALKTQVIEPTLDMPQSVFVELAKIAMFTELMDRTDDGRVLWDQDRSTIFAPESFEAEYHGMHAGYINVAFEVPEGAVGLAMVRAAEHDAEVRAMLAEAGREASHD